jgi:hypothetical protein
MRSLTGDEQLQLKQEPIAAERVLVLISGSPQSHVLVLMDQSDDRHAPRG